MTAINNPRKRSHLDRRYFEGAPVLGILALLWILFGLTAPSFASLSNVRTVLASTATIAVAAAGESLVLISGGLDLSVASVAACSGILAARVMGPDGNVFVGLVTALAVGLLFGLVNGFFISRLRLTPFIFTLGTHLIARGIAFSTSKGYALKIPRVIRQFGNTDWLGIPAVAIIAICIFIAVGFLLARTTWGRYIYLLGANEQATRYAGIRGPAVKLSIYVASGFLAGLGGFLSLGYLGAAVPGMGDAILLTIVGGVIVGGTSLFGGEGSIVQTVIGVLLLATLSNGLNLLGFDFWDQLIAQGLVILLSIGLVIKLFRKRYARS